MDRVTVEEMIKNFGSGSPEFSKKGCVIYETGTKYDDPLDVIINGTNLYVDDRAYLKFEVDDWGLVIRLYYGSHYISAIVNQWEDIKEFNIDNQTIKIGIYHIPTYT